MLGTLAGISVAFISMRPAFQMWEVPWIGLVCFAIVLIAWTANIRLPGGVPGGLAAVIVGSVIGWVVSLIGWSDYMQPAAVTKSFEQFGLRVPLFSSDVWQGLAQVAPLLVTAIPLGIYNFTEAMNNVESASAAGDNYNLRKVLLADGVGAIVGSMLGSPFPPAVYIGHPGWKAVGGRIGYSLATGFAIAHRLLPRTHGAAARADSAGRDPADPALYRPRHRRAGVPGDAEEPRARGRARADSQHRRVGEDADRRRARRRPARRPRSSAPPSSPATGVLYKGLESLGGGSVLAGMVLGRDRRVHHRQPDAHAPRSWAFAGAILAYFGLIHGAQLGWAVSPLVALGYAMFGATCLALGTREPNAVANT